MDNVLIITPGCICALCFVDTKPRMDQLMMLKSTEGVKVKIIGTVAPDWKAVGILVDLDPNARKVKSIETDHAHRRNGSIICCQEIFRLWLNSPDNLDSIGGFKSRDTFAVLHSKLFGQRT